MTQQADSVVFHFDFLQNEKTIAGNPKAYGKHARNRKYYSSNQDNDFVGYVATGISDFIDYAGDVAKSSGVFGKNGLMNFRDKVDLREKLRTTDSVIWYGFLSFREEFSSKYCDDYQTAMAMLQKEFPRFLQNAGLDPNNITWYAGFHENTEHKHIHISWFENEPKQYLSYKKDGKTGLRFSKGFISQYVISEFKKNVEMNLIGNQIFPDRDKLLRVFRNQLGLAENQKMLLDLHKQLPPNVRKGYNDSSMSGYHSIVDSIVARVIISDNYTKHCYDDFQKKIKEHDKEIMRICKGNQSKFDRLKRADKYANDLKRRLGNVIISSAFKVYGSMRLIESEKKEAALKGRRMRKQYRKALMDELYLSAKLEQAIQSTFQDFLRELDSAEYKRLVEEGIIEAE